ncbi:MAG: TRAP transporter substrate-binding protein [Planctomycetota bacterium]|jgi:tripartite ATP-independent transporter DctP family solute receptor|nr:TRAP transporter substrate-binding protein [Planctomycetota bacterium]
MKSGKNRFRFGWSPLFLAAALLLPFRVAPAAQYSIKMGNPSNPEDNCVKAFFLFEKLVEERSKGAIDVQVFHSAQLGAHRDYIEGLQMGSLQAAEINTAVLTASDSKFMVFDLPYISRNTEHFISVLNAGLGEKLAASLLESTGIRIIGWMIRSPRSVYNSRGPIRTAADFSGLKIRIMESPIMSKTFSLLGAVPVPLAASERYMALQTKVVDAAENSVPLVITQKEYEVTKYLSLTEHFSTPNIIGMDANFLNGLPADLRKIVLDAGREAGEYATKLDSESVAAAIEELKKLGMEVNFIADKSSFIEKVRPLYDEYRDEIGGDVIDAFN